MPSFGPEKAALLIVGLAPGAQGANRTGRPFTGDYAGEVLYPALARYGLSQGCFAARADDGLELVGCRITNAVRCVPPQNRPVGKEIEQCRQFLRDEITRPPAPHVILTLGRIAYESVLRVLRLSPSRQPFAHGRTYETANGPAIVASYHCSRYNINTGRLTVAMFDDAVARAVELMHAKRATASMRTK